MTEDILKDFDVLEPPKRTAKIGGKEVDVSKVSPRVTAHFFRVLK